MTPWRRFERSRAGVTEYVEIRREGIRCFLRWGSTVRRDQATMTVLPDEERSRRHLDGKVRDRLRAGFVEVPVVAEPVTDVGEPVVETLMRAQARPWFTPQAYRPVEGFADVFRQNNLTPHGSGGFHHYLVLRDAGRAAVALNVAPAAHDPDQVAAFLETVTAHRDLPFDGTSHHKISLPRPVGRFSHALFCSPALGRPMAAYPALADRVAVAAPIHDCEIGDDDPEAVVDARIHGHGSLRYADWSRSAQPAIDARFDLPSRRGGRDHKVYALTDLPYLLDDLRCAGPGSWLEVRRFRGDVRRLVPGDVTPDTIHDVERFLLGAPELR